MPKWVPGCFLFLSCCCCPPPGPLPALLLRTPCGGGKAPSLWPFEQSTCVCSGPAGFAVSLPAKAGPGQPKGLILP